MIRLPPHGRGLRVGLFGGSFDPPHEGHLHVARMALTRLKLDRLWWLVTPGNPLKDHSRLTPLPERLAAARAMARDPRIVVTDIEGQAGFGFTVETLRFLRARCPGVRFVWIMGGDGLANLHRWRGWREIAALAPFAVIDRPGETLRAKASPAARALAGRRLPEECASRLALARPPAWVYLHGPRSPLSSTEIRRSEGRRSD
ncbi:MAG: nicotinate-nucleotide adenylyltransferase [Salinarimonadaceae bacterium]|nr:MAG: nicotinate-nucleotide adenylyltransferase [Salinarimonadaceae bacterium]